MLVLKVIRYKEDGKTSQFISHYFGNKIELSHGKVTISTNEKVLEEIEDYGSLTRFYLTESGRTVDSWTFQDVPQ